MNDLIERSAVIDLIDKYTQDMSTDYWTANYGIPSGVFEDEIMDLPSVQPEIIRCGECKYYKPMSNHWGKCGVHSSPAEKYRTCQICDYCSWAERRTDETVV